jgi:hypothetical protein
MSSFDATIQQVQSRKTDMRQLVNAIDPFTKQPIVVYEFPNGREFTEPQDQPYRWAP